MLFTILEPSLLLDVGTEMSSLADNDCRYRILSSQTRQTQPCRIVQEERSPNATNERDVSSSCDPISPVVNPPHRPPSPVVNPPHRPPTSVLSHTSSETNPFFAALQKDVQPSINDSFSFSLTQFLN